MKIVDLKINIDGLILDNDEEAIENFIADVEKLCNSTYNINYEVLYEEIAD